MILAQLRVAVYSPVKIKLYFSKLKILNRNSRTNVPFRKHVLFFWKKIRHTWIYMLYMYVYEYIVSLLLKRFLSIDSLNLQILTCSRTAALQPVCWLSFRFSRQTQTVNFLSFIWLNSCRWHGEETKTICISKLKDAQIMHVAKWC